MMNRSVKSVYGIVMHLENKECLYLSGLGAEQKELQWSYDEQKLMELDWQVAHEILMEYQLHHYDVMLLQRLKPIVMDDIME